MPYFVLSRNGEASFNTFLSKDPDPDYVRGGLSDRYITSCVKESSQTEQLLLSYAHGQTDRQTD